MSDRHTVTAGFTRKSLATRLREGIEADPVVAQWRYENPSPTSPIKYVVLGADDKWRIYSPGELAEHYGEPILDTLKGQDR
jgi:hypothetical protein